MTKSLDILKSIYKPYRYTIIGKAIILNTTSGDFIVKEKNNDIKEIYHYLRSRNFNYFPKLVDGNRNEVNVYEYIEDTSMPKEQKLDDLLSIVSLLHNKTSYYKEVSADQYKEIYDNIKSNIDYLNNYYNELYEQYKLEVYMSPSHYSLMRNIYKIFAALSFCEGELDSWYELVKDERKQRVALIHNNLEVDHYIRNNDGYLISWDKAKIDTPVLDIVNLYQKEYFNYDFKSYLDKYLSHYHYNEAEKKLLFILLSLPPIIEINDNEYKNTVKIREKLDYIFKTEALVRPYYSKEQ